MSYILDALKKSEREKTLGQVPTLETVISDGAKKQSNGTPSWLNLLVFLLLLTAILVGMYFTGLINFDSKKETFSATNNSTQNQNQAGQPTAKLEPVSTEQTAVNQAEQVEQVVGNEGQVSETAPQQVQEQQVQAELMAESEIQQQAENTAVVSSETETQEVATAAQQALIDQQAQEIAALEQLQQAQVTEAQQPALQVEPEVQQSEETGQTAAVQSQGNSYEETLHQNLRNIAVNVVSYSSDARQRFVMLDLTIYKEGDSLSNGADIVEIQRNGAIVEFQNKRYLLKP